MWPFIDGVVTSMGVVTAHNVFHFWCSHLTPSEWVTASKFNYLSLMCGSRRTSGSGTRIIFMCAQNERRIATIFVDMRFAIGAAVWMHYSSLCILVFRTVYNVYPKMCAHGHSDKYTSDWYGTKYSRCGEVSGFVIRWNIFSCQTTVDIVCRYIFIFFFCINIRVRSICYSIYSMGHRAHGLRVLGCTPIYLTHIGFYLRI